MQFSFFRGLYGAADVVTLDDISKFQPKPVAGLTI